MQLACQLLYFRVSTARGAGQRFLELVIGASERIACLLHHQCGDIAEHRNMQGVRLRMSLDATLCLIYRSDDRLRRRRLSVGKLKLRIDGTEVARRSEVDMVCSKHKKGAGALRLNRYDHGQLRATRLRLTHQPQRRFTVTARGRQHHVEVVVGISVIKGFFKQSDAGREQPVNQDDETAPLRLLVFLDQGLPLVPRRMLRFVERTPTRLGGVRGRSVGVQVRGRGSSIEKTIGLPCRALRPSSHALLARSIRSRQ